MKGISHFGIVDYVVVSITLLSSLAIGVYYAIFGKQTNETLLVGGRSMSTFPVSASIMVTYLSAITIMGYPAEVYSFGIEIFVMTMVASVFIPLSAITFVPVFYDMKLTSIYEYLEVRFDSLAVRWLASLLFIFQQMVLTGIVLYAPAIALQQFLGLPIWISVIGIGLCGTIYTSIGGLKAVVWTDTFQFLMVVTGLLAIVIRGFIKVGGIKEAFQIAHDNGRLELFNFTFDPFMRHNFFNFLLGQGFHAFLQPGTHQLQVQRYSSLPTKSKAIKSIICSVPLKIIVMSLCLVTGIAIFANHAGCDPVLLGTITKADQIVPLFVIEELTFIPGMMGLFTSCIFSAVLSSVSSSLNSMAAVTWEDFILKTQFAKKLGDFGQTNVIRIISFLYGIICISLALVAQNFGTLYTATMSIVGITSGSLGSIFLLGLLMPCINKFGAFLGMVIGVSFMTYISTMSKMLGKSHFPLPTSIKDCPAEAIMKMTVNMTNIVNFATHPGVSSYPVEWPEKLYTLSYVLYPFVGAVVTISSGIIISLLTRGCFWKKAKSVKRSTLHPWILMSECCVGPDDRNLTHATSHRHVDRVASLHNVFTASTGKLNSKPPSYKYESVPNSPHPENFELQSTKSSI